MTSVRSGRFRLWVWEGQDSSTARADPEQDTAMQRQDLVQYKDTPSRGQTRVGGPPSRTCAGRVQRLRRIWRSYIAESPSSDGQGPWLGCGLCEQICAYFRNKMMENRRGKVPPFFCWA